MQLVSTRFDRSTIAQLRGLADADGVSIPEMVRRLVALALREDAGNYTLDDYHRAMRVVRHFRGEFQLQDRH